ncbi:nucleotidyltransferase family protein [Treponema sp. R6D11]
MELDSPTKTRPTYEFITKDNPARFRTFDPARKTITDRNEEGELETYPRKGEPELSEEEILMIQKIERLEKMDVPGGEIREYAKKRFLEANDAFIKFEYRIKSPLSAIKKYREKLREKQLEKPGEKAEYEVKDLFGMRYTTTDEKEIHQIAERYRATEPTMTKYDDRLGRPAYSTYHIDGTLTFGGEIVSTEIQNRTHEGDTAAVATHDITYEPGKKPEQSVDFVDYLFKDGKHQGNHSDMNTSCFQVCQGEHVLQQRLKDGEITKEQLLQGREELLATPLSKFLPQSKNADKTFMELFREVPNCEIALTTFSELEEVLKKKKFPYDRATGIFAHVQKKIGDVNPVQEQSLEKDVAAPAAPAFVAEKATGPVVLPKIELERKSVREIMAKMPMKDGKIAHETPKLNIPKIPKSM